MKTQVKIKGQARLFQNPILEFFTKSSLIESTLSSVAISVICIWAGYWLGAQHSAKQVALWFLGGFLTWSFFEYLLHRYFFHIAETAFKGSARLQYIIHGVHHEYPNDAQRTLLPTLPKIILTIPFFTLYWLIFGNAGAFFASGFLMGYYVYSLIHYSIHRFKAPKFFKPLWEHHHRHHHLNEDKAFGVSSTIWDHVFNTMPPQKDARKVAEVINKSDS
ncbi:MAG: sterol desaturase family protein [Lewinellaceae bacterium]|jgi:sterol desaturase/sphingolipid hydroxylase (fatty acid hydroxylase superfamily)|nr:sterol desaturase family protein [Lewinellaceae bacterium]